VAAQRLLRITVASCSHIGRPFNSKSTMLLRALTLNQGTPGTMGAAVARAEQEGQGRDEEGGDTRTVKFKEEEGDGEGDEEEDRKRARACAHLQ
jgi:hypothetical protein